ncbi:hypothetical protein M409DRAFT_31088 [Zasmidium cellare ATCC 36951]|uniref:NAD(P)-binding protein n=1 Tax=Zasmidium cellare ATCC 36951 TaxID=1080233 RepID=A0A6A6BXW4_ZASCE|nr:uncharacterized protein M409DRAFT_31088 [Zasmidium cellare ATCC 36951]KAF2158392.1 hypothetical protein M409DRAFT_31088 [Zasmidium cellare ATCC 36951]
MSKQLLERGEKVIATARNIDSIKPLKELGAATLQLDVTAGFDELKSKVEEAVSFYGRIDVFFANASFVHFAPVEEADVEKDIFRSMNTLTFGVTNILRSLMPHWRKQKSGFLLVNSSYTAFWSTVPGCGTYMAAKAALDRLVTTFAAEIADQDLNIRTLTVHPGHFRTNVTHPTKYDFDRPTTSYNGILEWGRGAVVQMYGNQPGDTGKACKVMIDLVKGEGDAKGKTLPPSLPLGTDAWETCVQETEAYLQRLKDWEHVIRSTDVVPGSSAWGEQMNLPDQSK